MISVFDIYKIGIGPSSSHTVGPMKAGKTFIDDLLEKDYLDRVDNIKVEIYGSLSLTGKGHATDLAIIMGLAGYSPDNVDIDHIPKFIEKVKKTKKLNIGLGKKTVFFDFDKDMDFRTTFLPLHENGMKIHACEKGKHIYTKTYYSIGGGFIVDEEHFGKQLVEEIKVPYEYKNACDLLKTSKENNLSLYEIILANEKYLRDEGEISENINKILKVMFDGIDKGLHTEGYLPGIYKVHRRAPGLHKKLVNNKNKMSEEPMQIIEWVNSYALAVSEENAAGGRIVTSPTNGACGIIPAVLKYYVEYIRKLSQKEINSFFLVSGLIGILYKMNASISGAEVGCQGEVGVACSMAAGGITALSGGTIEQIFIAAEIAMEHNLGLTCDPLAGQVQVPCIERNAIASVKAINASRLALDRDPSGKDAIVSLDDVIETMYQTGKNLKNEYRETSLGGLAIVVKSHSSNLCD